MAFEDYISRRLQRPRFAQGRSVRNAVERARMRQATRLFDAGGRVTREDLVMLAPQDILGSSVFDDTAAEGQAGALPDVPAHHVS